MKQFAIVIPGIAMILLFLSCQSVDLTKKHPNMIADADPVSAGTVEAQLDRFLSSKVNKVEIAVVFHPRLNAVSLEFKYELLKYRQFWDEPARKQFAASLELYKRDFEDRKLANNSRKTRDVYGKTKGRVEWEAFKYAKTRVSNPTIELGYRFKEDSAFFTTLMRSAKEVMSEGDSSSPMDSQQISMYFTRAQADELVKLFDQAHLIGLLGTKYNPVTDEVAADAAAADAVPRDNYREYGD
jgi:hypothetical protein